MGVERAARCLLASVGQVFPIAVMRFMGDAPLKGQSELDVLYTLLKVSPSDFARCSLSGLCGSVSPSVTQSCRTLGRGEAQRGVHPAGGEGAGERTPGLSPSTHPVLLCLGCGTGPGLALPCNGLPSFSCVGTMKSCGTNVTAKL